MLSLPGSSAGTGQQAAALQLKAGRTCSRRFKVRASPLVAAFRSSAEEDIEGAGAHLPLLCLLLPVHQR